MRRVFFAVFLMFPLIAFGQSYYDWWNELHNYPDAAGPNRRRYINISPGYMGPNALPIVRQFNGSYDEDFWVDVQWQWHDGNGESTQNLFARMNIPVAKDRVNLYIISVPYEQWETNAQTRDERRMVNLGARGRDTGDVLFGFNVIVLNEEEHFVNALFNVEVKSTTGSGIENARFTDHGLYTYSGHFGKTLLKGEHQQLLVKSMLGFVTWQTNQNNLPGGSNHLQNDAYLYGFGVEWDYGKLEVDSDISGYTGYLGNRDNPLFWRSQIQYNFSRLAFRAEYNTGFRWWDWNSINLGIRYHFIKNE